MVTKSKLAAADAASGERLPSFRKPPVAEVVAGVLFREAIPGFLTPHAGLFWNRIKREFPETQHSPPLIPPNSEPRWVDVIGLPLPRIWLISKSKHHIIQLQGDCFFYNWRKLTEGDIYPRHPALVDGFEKYLREFVVFLKEEGLPEPTPSFCELTYTNYVPHGQGWRSMADIAKIFTDFCWQGSKERYLPNPNAMNWTATFPLPEKKGTLTAQLLQVVKQDGTTPALRLDLSARGLGDIKTFKDIRPWFEVARTAIVKGFADLTTEDAQVNLWEREDG